MALVTKKIYDSGFQFFTLKTLQDILQIKKEATFYSVLKRLLKNGVLLKIERDKYLLKNGKANNFSLANFLYKPSYVSFESALNIYGILSQFPQETTSATPRKTKEKIINGRIFSFTHLKKSLFWGYEKKKDFLIALPEKAFLDQLYLASKGLKSNNLDEYDLSFVNQAKVKRLIKKFPKTRQFKSIVEKVKEFLN